MDGTVMKIEKDEIKLTPIVDVGLKAILILMISPLEIPP